MQSLTDLNSHSRTIIEVSDSRSSGVVLDRNRAAIQDQKVVAAVNMTVPTAVDILEIINYATANVRFKITIVTPSPALSPTSISWAVIPAGLTLTTSGQSYTVSGIKTAAEWNVIKNPTWIIPSGYSSKPIWYLTCELIWYDSSLGEDQSVSWDTYDDDFYYNAKIEATSNLTCTIFKKNGTGASLSASSSLTCDVGDNLFSKFTLSCSITKYKGAIANLTTTTSLTALVADISFSLDYSVSAGETISMTFGGVNNISINWGDSQSNSYTTSGEKTHTYSTAGTKTIKIYGSYTSWKDTTIDLSSLIRVNKFPESTITSLSYAFWLCTGLIAMPSTLPSSVTDLSYCFSDSTFNIASSVSLWDTSNVTNMKGMFYRADSFNQPLGSWNTSKVTDMSYMFAGDADFRTIFNQDISSWNTALVQDMSWMFYDNKEFNQPIGNWNTQNVRDMRRMFSGEVALQNKFNQPIGNWNVSNVTNMQYMFANCPFNQAIGNWNVSNVTDFTAMFYFNTAFNQPIGNWNTVSAITLRYMFLHTSFNQPIGSWNVSNVIDFVGTFSGQANNDTPTWTNSFNQPLLEWNTAKATRGAMEWMFANNPAFDQNISSWPVPLISLKPNQFDRNTNASWTTAEKPQWGT